MAATCSPGAPNVWGGLGQTHRSQCQTTDNGVQALAEINTIL